MKLDPRTIMQFSVIAEEASFTKASARLRVAQPWLSARLRKLEDQLGFPLFLRNTRKVVLTERGAEFLQAARSVAAAMEQTEALAARLRRLDEKRLRIGAPPYSNFIPERRELIDRFSTDHREVTVELDVGWTPSLLARVQSGDLDFAFAMGRVEENELESILLCTIRLDLAVSRDDPLAGLKKVTPNDLAGRLVALLSRSTHPNLIDELCVPLVAAGSHLVQIPEVSESILERIGGPEQLTAVMFRLTDPQLARFADAQFAKAGVVRRPLDLLPEVPFSLVRRRGAATPISSTLWDLASGPERNS